MELPDYFLEQKKELLRILQIQKGLIGYQVMDEIFFAKDISSGQTSYKAKTIAILEYLLSENNIVIIENNETTNIDSQDALAEYYNKKSLSFTSFSEEVAPYRMPQRK